QPAVSLREQAALTPGRRHDGNPMLEWCFNVVGEPDRRGKFYPTKQRPEQKIDAEPERRCCAHGGGGPSDNGGQWAGGHFGVFAQSHFRLIGLPPAYRPVRKWPRESAAMRPGGQMPTKTAEKPKKPAAKAGGGKANGL